MVYMKKIAIKNQDSTYDLFLIKQGLLIFWACWFSLAFLSNFVDLLTATHVINGWRFHSGNYEALAQVLSIYHTPHLILLLLFSMNTGVQSISASLFIIAAICFWRGNYMWPAIYLAFAISMGLWAIFLIMEEVFIAYKYEPTHMNLLLFELISLLALRLLPHQKRANA